MPVAATRWPTKFGSFSVLAASTSSTDDDPFLRKPDLQLRDFGTSAPDAFLSQNVPSSARAP
jgi:hypothetical protein